MTPLFILEGTVSDGKKRGKDLGFPTINFPADPSLPEGIFVSHAIIDNHRYNALTFIGTAKTYNETTFQAETYLLAFNQDVYGKKVIVEVLKKLRDNKKFESEEALITEMKRDKQQAEEFFKTNKK